MTGRYTVSPTPHAVGALTRLWTQSGTSDRAAITQASHLIDTELRVGPDQKGVDLAAVSQGLRCLDIAPLRAYFRVVEPDRLVFIDDYERIT